VILALIGALLIGLSLGLLGSGGSMLTVPVLVYVLGHTDKQAITASLAIVGSIALVGALPYARRRQIDWRNVLYFGIPGMLGAYLGAIASKPIPGSVLLSIFALIMLLASYMILRKPALNQEATRQRRAIWKIMLDGLIVGAITGLVGVGGGFLIVPALILFGGLPAQFAVGTSLAIIAMNSASGFYKRLDAVVHEPWSIDWSVIGLFIIVGVAGSFAGQFIGSKINQRSFHRLFGWFLIVMALYILGRELILKRSAPESPASQITTAADD